MNTMDCSTLETLIENNEQLDLIDIRSQNEFALMHIPGARSLPLAELSQPRLSRRIFSMDERVYVISDDRGSASLAAGILKASGDIDAVVIDGGMKAWIDKGLPVRRESFGLNLPRYLRASGALLALACIGFATSKPFTASLILATGAALLISAHLLEKTPRCETPSSERENSDSGWAGLNSPENATAY